LVCKGNLVQDESEFSAQGILPGSVLFCCSKLCGGGKSSNPHKRKTSEISTGACSSGMLDSPGELLSLGEPTGGSQCYLWIQNVDT